MLHAIPTGLVFAALGGIMFIGHETGWKLSKFSDLRGTATPVTDDWCDEHLVPESGCIECRPELLPKREPFEFCQQHGVTDCVNHHPEIAQVKGEPHLPQYDTVAAIDLLPRPTNNSLSTLHESRVQFASIDSFNKTGIEVDIVGERPMADIITANGELIFDPTRVGHLATRTAGTVAAVYKTVGDRVSAGEVLALIDAAQVGQAKSQFLQALVQRQLRAKTVGRLRPIADGGAVSERTMDEAESALQEAEVQLISSRQTLANLGFDLPADLPLDDPQALSDRLRFLDIPPGIVAALPPATETANLFPIRAPFDGAIVYSEVVAGEVVDTAKTLFTVSDPSRMWLVLNVRQEDAAHIRPGLEVEFESDEVSEQILGRIDWISPVVDSRTRTLQVRVIVSNPNGSLKDHTFGTGRIILRREPNAVVVPASAVQATPDAQYVFVRDKHYFDEESPKFFHVRQVRTGARDDGYVEILAGVLPGEVIAAEGSNVLLSQLLRSNLGAGCGCHED